MESGHIGISVITFLSDGKGKYLIGKRSMLCRDERGKWEPLGGGALHFGERIEDAVKREVKEETGADARNVEFLGFRDVHRVHDGARSHWVALDFRAEVSPEEVRIGEPDKCDALAWFTIEELNTMQDLHSQFPVFLEKYKQKLI